MNYEYAIGAFLFLSGLVLLFSSLIGCVVYGRIRLAALGAFLAVALISASCAVGNATYAKPAQVGAGVCK